METTIHQLLCGEVSKAWGLLNTSMQDTDLAKSIAFKADLQDRPPSGVLWKPILRGFSYKTYFLLLKTYPDLSKEVRPGRVFSHVLAIPLGQLSQINDISALLSYFPENIDKSASIPPILFDSQTNKQLIKSPRFNKVIHGLSSLQQYENSIIWVGQEQYEESVCNFWKILHADERKQANFGIYFNPSEIPNDRINFLAIPDCLEKNFNKRAFCLVKKGDAYVLNSFAEQFIAGNPAAISRIESFRQAIEANTFTRNELEIVSKGIDTFENLDTITDIKKINTLSHIVAAYSPKPQTGAAFKQKLLDQIVTIGQNIAPENFHVLKSFKIDCFQNSEKVLSKVVEKWCSSFIFSDEKDGSPLLSKYYTSTSKNWWTKVIEKELNRFFWNLDESKVKIIYRWLSSDFSLFSHIAPLLPKSSIPEDLFVTAFDLNTTENQHQELIEFAIERNWLVFHARLIKEKYTFEETIEKQLLIDKYAHNIKGIELLTTGIPASTIIALAVLKGEKRLLKIAGRLCKNDVSLLANIDVKNSHWQEMWANAIAQGNKVEDGIIDPQIKIIQLLEWIVEGNTPNRDLVNKISKSKFADLLNFPQREALWEKLPYTAKDNFLERTAMSALNSISENPSFDFAKDKILYSFMKKESTIQAYINKSSSNIKRVLPILQKFTGFPQKKISAYIDQYSGEIDVIDATDLGRLAHRRSYSRLANSIFKKLSAFPIFKIALKECHSELGFFAKAELFFVDMDVEPETFISPNQWWQVFNETVIKLYPNGPMQQKIWLQAEGEEYDLLTKGTGKEVWMAALKKLRNGGGTGITLDKLMEKIKAEHGNNEHLDLLLKIKSRIHL